MRILTPILGAAAAIALIAMHFASAAPVTNVDFTKTGTTIGDTAYFTVTVRNNSPLILGEDKDGSDTKEVHYTPALQVKDLVPAGTWFLLSAYAYTEPGGPATAISCTDFLCAIPPLPGRHLNIKETDFVSGEAVIQVYGVLAACGEVKNTAILFGLTLPRTASAFAGVPCPTVVPTIPATATPGTVELPTLTPTKTPFVAPKPPNTGDTGPETAQEGYGVALFTIAVMFTVSGLALGVYAFSRRNR